MKYLIVSGTACEKYSLESLGFKIIRLPSDVIFAYPLSSHADMLSFVNGKSVFMYEDYYETNSDRFSEISEAGYKIIKVNNNRADRYPDNIALNVFALKNHLFGNMKYVASEVLEYAKERGIKTADIKQGYSACSTLVLDEAVISQDDGIIKAAEKAGIGSLKIRSGSIELPPYEYGFIGGCSFVSDKTVYFFGDLMTHEDGKRISDFLSCNGYDYVSLGKGRLEDYGGAKVL